MFKIQQTSEMCVVLSVFRPGIRDLCLNLWTFSLIRINLQESLSETFEALSQELLVRKGLNPVPLDGHPLPSRSGRRAESLGSPGKVIGEFHTKIAFFLVNMVNDKL